MKSRLISLIIGFLLAFILMIFVTSSFEKGEAEIVVGEVKTPSPGLISIYSGSSVPTGYLLCDGRAISRTTYAGLFKVIGTTYGEGDGNTTFNVPNLNGRVPVGKDSSTFTTLGATGGSSTTTLTASNMPAHTHTATAKGTVASTFTGSSATTSSNGAATHTYSGTTSSNGNHSHTTYHRGYWNFQRDNNGGEVFNLAYYTEFSTDPEYKFGYTNSAGAHTHTFSGTTSSSGAHTHTVTAKGNISSTFTGTSITTSSTGNGSSFTNLQPYTVINYVIKY